MSQEKQSRLDKMEKDVKNLTLAVNNTLQHIQHLNKAIGGMQMIMENLPGIEDAIAKAKEEITQKDSGKKTEEEKPELTDE